MMMQIDANAKDKSLFLVYIPFCQRIQILQWKDDPFGEVDIIVAQSIELADILRTATKKSTDELPVLKKESCFPITV